MKGRPHERSLLSLFTGAGGLDLGLEAAGFGHSLCVEIDPDSRRTLALNRPKWRLSNPGDIHALSPKDLLRQIGIKPRQLCLLAGGPPCQPFSKSSYWATGDSARLKDPRSKTLRSYLKVVETMLPQVLLLENVRGLTFEGKNEGLRLLKRGLQSINRSHRTSYKLQILTLNAADFGVPQIRERVFLVACIDGSQLDPPNPTHGVLPSLKPRLTAWDAIGDLDKDCWPDELEVRGRWAKLLPSIPEGQNYLWHTPRNNSPGSEPLFGWRTRYWSFLLKLAKNLPSWTLQAEPGPAIGPFHWKNRQLSIEEMCRLQTIPDGYEIFGSRRSAIRQVGNAVPSALGELLGLEIRRQIFGQRVRRSLTLLPEPSVSCPPPEKVERVPRAYLEFKSNYNEHPGTGKGPAARRRPVIEAEL